VVVVCVCGGGGLTRGVSEVVWWLHVGGLGQQG